MKPEPLIDDWRNRGICRSFDPESSMPETRRDKALDAREACYRCPVRRECAEFARSNKAEGIWAGYHMPYEKRVLERYLDSKEVPADPVSALESAEPAEYCESCSCEMYRPKDAARRKPGQRVHGGLGLCGTCYMRRIRQSQPPVLVDPRPALEHMARLLAAEMTLTDIAMAAALKPRTVQVVWSRKTTKIHKRTSDQLRSVQVPQGVAS